MSDTLSDSDVGLMSDDEVGLGSSGSDQQQPDTQAPTPPAGGQSYLSDADVGLLSDDQVGLSSAPQIEGPVATAARFGANAVVPGAAGLLVGGAASGAVSGALEGSVAGPVGTVVGAGAGLLAGGVAAYLASKAQTAAKQGLGIDDSTQMALDVEANPWSAFGGEMAGNLATMRPDRAATLAARGVSAAVMGGVEAGQELYNEGTIDPAKVLAAGGAGALLPSPNAAGELLERQGARLARAVPGRPNVAGNPEAAPSKDEAAASQQPVVEGEAATVQVAPSDTGDTVGNPQSSPTRSDRAYPKGQATAESAAPDMLTQGDISPDVAAALQGFRDFKPEAPANPNDIDQSLKEAPVQTGFPQEPAAPQAQPQPNPNAGKPTLQLRRPQPAPETRPVAEAPQPIAPTSEKVPQISDKPVLSDADVGVGEGATPEVHPDAQKVAEVRNDVVPPKSAAQAEAGNYAKGHPGRLFGREVSIETPKGGTREDTKNTPPKWSVPDFPYDYGEFLGTKGADGDRVDVGVVGTGDRHFVIDQRNLDTGKFDEHKPMVYAKDEADAVDHYVRGFTDGKGQDRIGAVTEVTPDEMKAWLAKPGKKKTPYSPDFKEGTPQPGAEEAAAPATSEATPKVVTAAVNKMRADGVSEDAIKQYLSQPVGEQLAIGQKALRNYKGTGNVARPNRLRGAPPVVEGIKNDQGEPVTARDKGDAARKSADVKTMNDAYEKLGDVAIPTTDEEKAALRSRLQTFLYDTKNVKYRPAFKHAPYVMARAAKKLLMAKNPTDKGWQSFVSDALTPDETRATHRIESDIGMSRRSGDEAIMNAESAQAHGGVNEEEDNLIEALDRARESEGRFDIPHEEAEAMVKPERVAAASDLQRIEGAKDHIDTTEPGGRAQLAKKLSELADRSKKGGAAGSTKGPVALEGSENKPGSAVRKIDVKSLPADYMKNLLERASKPKNTSRLDSDEVLGMLKDKSPTVRGLGEAFMRDDAGVLNVDKIMQDLKSAASKLFDFSHQPRRSYRARDPRSVSEDYSYSLSDDLFKLRQGDVEHQVGLKKWVQSLPKELDQKARERMYFLREAGKLNLLTPREQQLYDAYLKPVFDQNDQLYHNIEAIDPWRLGPKVENHVYRVAKSGDEFGGLSRESADPIEGLSAISTAPKGTMLNRRFFAFEQNGTGNRFVASHNDDGYTIWHNRKPIKVVDPNFTFSPGDQYKVGSRTFTMKEAMTPEIEQHAMFDQGMKAEYYHDAALSAAAANYQLGAVARHLQYLDNMKKDADFRRFAVPPGAKAPADYVTTSLANFKDWKMHPHLANVLNDYAQPGINESAINTLRKISQGITKAIFWMPTAHAANVATHWFVGRGFRWLPFTGGYKSLAEDGLRAIKSVVAQDELQSELRNHGAGLIYGGVITQDLVNNMARGLDLAVKQNPSKWDPIARQFGIGPSDLVRAVYKASSKVMWAANDMFLTHAILENQRRGMSLPEAITHAERHIPNYRIPATIMGSGRGARIFAQIMAEPTLTVFGRYHYGVFNSYANIAKDLVRGNGEAKLDAVGNLFAMGLLAFAAYPVMDKAAQWLTGNDKASANRRGPLAIPTHLAAAGRGKEDITSAARTTFTLSPLLSSAIEQLANKDYRGKEIIQRGTVQKTAHGDARAAGDAALQEGEFLARGLVSPYATLASALDKGGNPATAVRDQALDIKTPSQKSIKYDAQSALYNQRHLRQFERGGGSGPVERLYNKVTR